MKKKKSSEEIEIKEYRQIGVRINVKLWTEFRGFAIAQGKTGTNALHEAMELYLEKYKK